MADTLSKSSFPTSLVDPLRPTPAAERLYAFTASPRAWLIPLAIGVACLVMSAVGWAVDSHQFYFSYLVGWAFCLTLTLGALFFVLIHHITRAHWSTVVRRLPETLLWGFPLLALLFIPVLIGLPHVYHWAHVEEVEQPGHPALDPILAAKAPYLNVPFFLVRIVLYFVIWTILAYRLYTLSVRQDVDPDPMIGAKLRQTSAWGIPVFAVTTAFASYDFLMSLDPHWYSTIYGVYIFAGSYWSAVALITLTSIVMQRHGGMLKNVVTVEHYHDLGRWMFAFTIFWAYIAFSQYMLIWYANIPEETIWYRHRIEHGWGYHSMALLFLHFIVPFLVLLPRAAKRSIPVLSFMAVWFLIMQWVDLHWLSMPVLHPDHAGFHWLDFTCWLGLFFVYLSVFLYRASRHSLVPLRDPSLPKSLNFVNI